MKKLLNEKADCGEGSEAISRRFTRRLISGLLSLVLMLIQCTQVFLVAGAESSEINKNGFSNENVLMTVNEAYKSHSIFSTEHLRIIGNDEIKPSSIKSVEFLDTMNKVPVDAWDVSEAGDGSVMAWITEDGVLKSGEIAWKLSIAGEGGVTANQDSSYLFCFYNNCQSIDFNDYFYTTNMVDMSNMFYLCQSLSSLDLSSFDTSHVTDMSYLFALCTSLSTLNVTGFDTSSVTNMSNMFNGLQMTKLNISSFDTSKVCDMSEMFMDCYELSDLNLKNFDTSNVTDMTAMFANCVSLPDLDLSNFDTTNVASMSRLFYGCSSLKHIDLSSFKTESVQNMESMFFDCSSLKTLDLGSFNTSKVTNMAEMFYNCSSLKLLNISSFDTSQANTEDMFKGASVSGNTTFLDIMVYIICTWQFLLGAALVLFAGFGVFILIIRQRHIKSKQSLSK